MRAIERTGQFKKDFKRVAKTPTHKGFERLLVAVLELLVVDKPLPPANVDHPLIGNWVGFRDCHIKPDLVLIYRQVDFVDAKTKAVTKVLQLARLGSHSEVFS